MVDTLIIDMLDVWVKLKIPLRAVIHFYFCNILLNINIMYNMYILN